MITFIRENITDVKSPFVTYRGVDRIMLRGTDECHEE